MTRNTLRKLTIILLGALWVHSVIWANIYHRALLRCSRDNTRLIRLLDCGVSTQEGVIYK